MRSSAQTKRIEGWGYPILLVFMLALFLVQPWAGRTDVGTVLVKLTYGAILVGALIVVQYRRWATVSGWVLVVTGLVLTLLPDGPGASTTQALGSACLLAVFLLVIGSFLGDLLQHPRVTVGTIGGSVCVFILIGIAWTLMYALADNLLVDAFHGMSPEGSPGRSGEYFFFSFVTLTTLGYGNITPARAETWSLATLEALVGQIYLVVLVASFVGRRGERTESPAREEDSDQ